MELVKVKASLPPEKDYIQDNQSKEEIKKMLEGNDMIFIVQGNDKNIEKSKMVADLTKEMGILTVGVVTLPFEFENSTRKEKMKKELESYLQENNVIFNKGVK